MKLEELMAHGIPNVSRDEWIRKAIQIGEVVSEFAGGGKLTTRVMYVSAIVDGDLKGSDFAYLVGRGFTGGDIISFPIDMIRSYRVIEK
jgi:hypothetical protein